VNDPETRHLREQLPRLPEEMAFAADWVGGTKPEIRLLKIVPKSFEENW
jgi:hypothetical protein